MACFVVATGALLFDIPYSISLVAQWMYRWPNKPGVAPNFFHVAKQGVTFGRLSNKLDLYSCPNMDQSYADPKPVAVFVYGGAWGSGDRTMHCLLASQMAKELNATVVCPDYLTYPKGNVLDMVQDITDSLLWVTENGHVLTLLRAERGVGYTIMDHYWHEKTRGAEFILHKAMVGIESFDYYSPITALKTLTSASYLFNSWNQ